MTIRFLAKVPAGWQVTSHIEPFTFPAGELHLKNTESDELPTGAVLYGADPADIITLGLWADYVHQLGEKAVAYIPYFPAARADRGVPFGAKVYADIINSFNLDEVVIFDPHSPVIVDLIHNVRVVDSAHVIKMAIGGRVLEASDIGYTGVIAPDKGAVDRAQRAAEVLHLPLFKATKERDFETGKLSHFTIEDLPKEGRLLIVDDLSDGGGTFRGLAEVAGIGRDRLSLWVSHGVFSGQADKLKENFSAIYTTDSHPGARREDVGAHVTPILPALLTR
jgi:ribose-phosphate pyrophosphokinase